MKQLLWALAVAIALVPVVNDVCAIDCGLERPPQCPLHQHAPEPCRHDHVTPRVGLPRTNVAAARPTGTAVAVIAAGFEAGGVFKTMVRVESPSPHPPRRSRPDVLRI